MRPSFSRTPRNLYHPGKTRRASPSHLPVEAAASRLLDLALYRDGARALVQTAESLRSCAWCATHSTLLSLATELESSLTSIPRPPPGLVEAVIQAAAAARMLATQRRCES